MKCLINYASFINFCIVLVIFCPTIFISQGCLRITTHTESFRFADDIEKPMDSFDHNLIQDAFDGWDIRLLVYSRLANYGPDGVGKNKYRIMVNILRPSDSQWPTEYQTMAALPKDLSHWITIDTIHIVFYPKGEKTDLLVDSAEVEEFAGSYHFGVNYAFNVMTVPKDVQKIEILFTARLFENHGELREEKTFNRYLFRYSGKGKGPYWWRTR